MNLTSEQMAAAQSPQPFLQVTACPGSGKTSTMVERVHYMLSSGVSPERMVVLTFTNRAAAEMRERLSVRLGKTVDRVRWIGTIHGFCLDLLNECIDIKYAVLNASQAQIALVECLRNAGCKYTSATQQFVNNWPSTQLAGGQLSSAAAHFHSSLSSQGFVSMSSLIPWGKWVARQRRLKFEVVVDECQDCSEEEAQFINLIGASIFSVGDPDQQIYEWRGAVGMDEVNHNAKASLTTTFRFGPAIARTAEKALGIPPMNTVAKNVDGFSGNVEVLTLGQSGVEAFIRNSTSPDAVQRHSVAVLCRWNAQVSKFRNMISPEDNVDSKLTDDNRQAMRSVLQYLVNPQGHSAAVAISRLVYGTSDTERLQAEASDQLISFPTHLAARPGFPFPDPGAGLDAAFKSGLLFPSSVEHLKGIWDLLAHKSMPSLLLAFEQDQARNDSPVMTVHKAKGLEFDRVIIPDFCLDTWRMKNREEERLLYVAITRAKHEVFFLVPEGAAPSPFMERIGA